MPTAQPACAGGDVDLLCLKFVGLKYIRNYLGRIVRGQFSGCGIKEFVCVKIRLRRYGFRHDFGFGFENEILLQRRFSYFAESGLIGSTGGVRGERFVVSSWGRGGDCI